MRIRDISLSALDGYALACTLYEPAGDDDSAGGRCTVVVAGATAVRRRYYDAYARYLCEHAVRVITFDYRGIGDSLHGDIRRLAASMRDWGEQDLAGVVREAAERFPGAELLLVGHSAGGQLLGLAGNNHLVRGMLGIAAQSGYWRLWPRPLRYAMALLWYAVLPGLSRLLSFFPARRLKLGENLPAGVAIEWARWCRSPDYIAGPPAGPLRAGFARFTGPILAYSFADDWMAPRPAVDSLLGFYANAQVEKRHVRPAAVGAGKIGHFGFFRDTLKDSLWPESLQWLSRHG